MKEESRIVEETRQKIALGELTYDQMKEKLIAAINKEYEKEGEPNIELINACEELLAELATDGQPLPESHQEKYGEVIRQNIQVSHHARNRRGFAKRLAVSLVVLVLLLGGGQVFLHREWFEHGTTDDEQQHTIQGFVVDPELVVKAIASNEGVYTLISENFQEVKNLLGFDLPQNLFLYDWDMDIIRIAIKPSFIKCSIKYQNDQNKHFLMHLRLFTNIESAFTSFEQDYEGMLIEVKGQKVYHYHNENNNEMMWLSNNCIYYCNGELTDEELLEIVDFVIGGYES